MPKPSKARPKLRLSGQAGPAHYYFKWYSMSKCLSSYPILSPRTSTVLLKIGHQVPVRNMHYARHSRNSSGSEPRIRRRTISNGQNSSKNPIAIDFTTDQYQTWSGISILHPVLLSRS
jgi:hypothetical protein